MLNAAPILVPIVTGLFSVAGELFKNCKTKCDVFHPFNKSKREACREACQPPTLPRAPLPSQFTKPQNTTTTAGIGGNLGLIAVVAVGTYLLTKRKYK
jgi:hypothetical protein